MRALAILAFVLQCCAAQAATPPAMPPFGAEYVTFYPTQATITCPWSGYFRNFPEASVRLSLARTDGQVGAGSPPTVWWWGASPQWGFGLYQYNRTVAIPGGIADVWTLDLYTILQQQGCAAPYRDAQGRPAVCEYLHASFGLYDGNTVVQHEAVEYVNVIPLTGQSCVQRVEGGFYCYAAGNPNAYCQLPGVPVYR